MFSKLKDKLKSALSVFSKKTQEEAQVEETLVEVEKAPKVEQTSSLSGPVIPESVISEPVSSTEPEVPILDDDAEVPVIEEKIAEPAISASIPEKKSHLSHEEKFFEEKKDTKKTLHFKAKVESPKVESFDKIQFTKKPVEKHHEKKIEPVGHKESKESVKDNPKKDESKQSAPQPTSTTISNQEPVQPEKKGFFGRLFSKKEEPSKEIVKEDKEDLLSKHESTSQHQPSTTHHIPEQKTEVKTQQPTPIKKETKTQSVTPQEPEQEPGFFGKLKQVLTTKTISAEKFEELFWELEIVLLENNVSVEVIERIKDDLKTELVDKPLPRDVLGKINDTLRSTIRDILTYKKVDLINNVKQSKAQNKPYVITFFGINGAGKTTSIAKLAHYFQQHKLSVVMAACDTFRAAAIQQLEEHANRLNVKIIKHDYGSDAAAVAFDAIKYAQKNAVDIVLIDTAGRLHSNTNLMAELEKIIRVTKPDLKVFVGESITGNDCVEQARSFNELVQMDGAILTKADVDEKGGAPLSISYVIKKPILFLGVGQGYADFEEFDVEKMVTRLGL